MEQDLELIKSVSKKNKLPEVKPVRFPSGVINRVYDLGNCVIKIEGSDLTNFAKGVLKFQPAVIGQLVALGAKVPRILDYSEFEGRPYILMEKAVGQNLIYDWLRFNLKEKENFIAQVCEQLQIFHSLKFDSYSIPIYQGKKFDNLKAALTNVVNFADIDKIKLKKDYREDLEFLEDFFAQNISLLDEKDPSVLIHNDIHLENIFHKGNEVTAIIDFDWATAAPRYYELWKIADVFYDPKKYGEEGLESIYQGYRMTEEFKFIKKHYLKLFETPDLLTKIRLFNLENVIYKITDYQKGRWSENVMIGLKQQINDFYRDGWLSEVLS